MSQQVGYESVLNGWEAWIKKSPRNFIRILDTETNTNMNNGSVGSRKTYFHWKHIKERYGSMVKFMDYLIQEHGLKKPKIFFRRVSGGNGSVNDPSMEDKIVDFSARLQLIKDRTKIPMETQTEASQKTPVQDPINGSPAPPNYGMPSQPAPAPFAPFAPPQYQQQPPPGGLGGAAMFGMGGAAAAAQAAGLGMYEFTELKKNAERAAEYKEDLAEKKKRISELEIENLDLKTKVNNAEQAKELAVMAERLEKRGIMDSEGIQKLFDMAPAVLQAIAAKNGAPTQAPGLNAPSNLSPVKQELVGYITGFQEVTDHVTQLLQQVLMLLLSNPASENNLVQLINQSKNGNNNG
jgi:hypothetical protein